jgi:hypothetical protein
MKENEVSLNLAAEPVQGKGDIPPKTPIRPIRPDFLAFLSRLAPADSFDNPPRPP